MKKCFLLACVAGTVAVAGAQTDQHFNGSDLTAVRVAPINPTYNQRITPVWSNGQFPGVNLAFFGSLYDGLDDISFVGTPWQGATGRTITQINCGIGQFSAGSNADIRFEFYSKPAVDGAGGGFTNTADMLAGQTPFATYTFAFNGSGNGIYSWFTLGTTIVVPDGIDQMYVRMSVLDQGTSNIWTGAVNAFLPGWANNLTVGQGSLSMGFNTTDINLSPYFKGGVAQPTGAAATNEHRTLGSSAAINGPGLYLVLSGDLVLPDPAGTIDLTGTCVVDSGVTLTPTLAANGKQFYKICLAGDAIDGLNQFLDMDTIGGGDASVAIWSQPDGQLLASDALDGGNGGAGLLSFGIGRRNGTGDSTQYDGRDGELLAGTYIVCVASGDADFGPAYTANAPGAGGSVTLNLKTNTNGTPAAASVPPALTGTAFDLGDISQIAVAPPDADMETGWVVWYRWDNCSDIVDDGDPNATGTYLDFSFDQSFAGSDPQAFVFDATGAAVYSADDEGPGAFPQFSWGDVSPARPPFGDGQDFSGQNGAMPAGEYYMAVGLFQVTPSIDPRWHARSTSGSSLTSAWTPYFENLSACGGCGCPADYNVDGGVDGSDIEAFFTDWESATGCSDTNQDGGVDGGDVETFFIFWEAGGC